MGCSLSFSSNDRRALRDQHCSDTDTDATDTDDIDKTVEDRTRRINLRNSDAELIARSVKREAPLVVAVGADFVTGFTWVLRWLVKLGAYVVLVGEFRTSCYCNACKHELRAVEESYEVVVCNDCASSKSATLLQTSKRTLEEAKSFAFERKNNVEKARRVAAAEKTQRQNPQVNLANELVKKAKAEFEIWQSLNSDQKYAKTESRDMLIHIGNQIKKAKQLIQQQFQLHQQPTTNNNNNKNNNKNNNNKNNNNNNNNNNKQQEEEDDSHWRAG